MASKIKVGGVSYLNTKPLLYGIEHTDIIHEIELTLGYPSQLAGELAADRIDIALLPVAAIPDIPDARIICDYGIAADGDVASVCLFSQVPVEEIRTVYLDYQSRTSVRLAELLLKQFWKVQVACKPAPEHYMEYVNGTTAGVIIGDRALKQLSNFACVYDLAGAWKQWTGLPFIFAGWVSNKELPPDFLERFSKANALGLDHTAEIAAANPFPYYDLGKYYTKNIKYRLDAEKYRGMNRFLSLL